MSIYEDIQKMEYTKDAISWLLHALKILFGDESIRRYIILHYYPNIKNKSKECIRTFDAFVKKGSSREEKAQEITDYCAKMSKKKDIVVFTATNIQQNKFDNETHFQSYIIDNNKKILIVIDPAYDSKKEKNEGIYMAEVSIEVVIPFFTNIGYEIKFADLSTPAQIAEDDVFCQSWSLYILLHKLKKNQYLKDLSFEIPNKQFDKYDMLLQFYKQIFTDMPDLSENLRLEYEGEILNSRGPNKLSKLIKTELLKFDPVDLLLNMTKYEMK